jgi:hypothetical protein
MTPAQTSLTRMAVIRLAAVVAAGSLSYAAAAFLKTDPLGPTLIASLILIAKLALTYRSDSDETE